MSEVYLKRCPKCKTEQPHSSFHKSKQTGDGMCCYCKSCQKLRPRFKPSYPIPTVLHPDGTKRCPKCGEVKLVSAFSKSLCRADHLNSTCRLCCTVYSIKKRGSGKKPKGYGTPEFKAKQKIYDASRDKSILLQRRKDWLKRNPDKLRQYNYDRRAKVLNAGGTLKAAEIRLVFARDGHKCLRCGSTEKLCIDHIKPLARGGTNEVDNLQVLCRMCNSWKAHVRVIDFRNTPTENFTTMSLDLFD